LEGGWLLVHRVFAAVDPEEQSGAQASRLVLLELLWELRLAASRLRWLEPAQVSEQLELELAHWEQPLVLRLRQAAWRRPARPVEAQQLAARQQEAEPQALLPWHPQDAYALLWLLFLWQFFLKRRRLRRQLRLALIA
jgi:hypothetical protein